MKKVLIHCGFEPLANPTSLDLIGRRVKIGDNLGNFFFPSGVMRTFMLEDTDVYPNYYRFNFTDEEIDRINSEYKYFILPLADAFRNGNERVLKGLTALVKRLTIPCVVIGVGLRAPYRQVLEPNEFDPVAREFVAAVLEKSAKLGLRGEFTGRYLESLGFKPESDFTVIGCPSMYLNGYNLKLKDVTQPGKVCINANTLANDDVNAFIRGVASNPRYEISVIQQKYEEMLSLYIDSGKKVPKNVYGDEIYKSLYEKDDIKFFTSLQSWVSYLKNVDVCINTRFHGTVASMLAGTPALIIPIDSRMKEMVEYHDIPRLGMADLRKSDDLAGILAGLDLHSPERVHKRNLEHYIDFLKDNDLETIYSAASAKQCRYDELASEIEWRKPDKNFDHAGGAERLHRVVGAYTKRAANKLGFNKYELK